MIKITLVRYDSERKTRIEPRTESFQTGHEAMERAYEWLHDPELLFPGTELYAYPGVRPDDGQPIDQDWDAIASPSERSTLKDCLVYAFELDRLEYEYGDPWAWHRWMADRRGFTYEDYYHRFGVWVGPGRPPLEIVGNDEEPRRG